MSQWGCSQNKRSSDTEGRAKLDLSLGNSVDSERALLENKKFEVYKAGTRRCGLPMIFVC